MENIADFLISRAVSEAIESARDMIFIEDWWLVGVANSCRGMIVTVL
jgi:hypothetical protein